jgi:molybdopterin converting factor small subunit
MADLQNKDRELKEKAEEHKEGGKSFFDKIRQKFSRHPHSESSPMENKDRPTSSAQGAVDSVKEKVPENPVEKVRDTLPENPKEKIEENLPDNPTENVSENLPIPERPCSESPKKEPHGFLETLRETFAPTHMKEFVSDEKNPSDVVDQVKDKMQSDKENGNMSDAVKGADSESKPEAETKILDKDSVSYSAGQNDDEKPGFIERIKEKFIPSRNREPEEFSDTSEMERENEEGMQRMSLAPSRND